MINLGKSSLALQHYCVPYDVLIHLTMDEMKELRRIMYKHDGYCPRMLFKDDLDYKDELICKVIQCKCYK